MRKGSHLSEEHKQKLRDNHWSRKGMTTWNKGLTKEMDSRIKGNGLDHLSDEHKQKLRDNHWSKNEGFVHPMQGKHHTEIARKKISLGKIGKHQSPETILKRSIALKKSYSKPELRNKISKLLKGHDVSKETRKKISISNKGHSVSEDTIQKIKDARAKQIFPLQDTKIEVKIQNFLQQLGVEYFTHKQMNIQHSYQCDIFIPSMNLVVECDGDYWHKYPTGNDLDHIRTSELIDKGFNVLRLWENEIKKMNINDFKDKIKGGQEK
jgi:very-short-patch-repair endonuclease